MKKVLYYGWVLVGVGVLVKATALGFGRFAYSMLLPSMRESLRFSYVHMGLLSGGILLGYLLFSFIAGMLATRFGPKRIVVGALLCSSLSMFFISRLSGFVPLLAFTFAMGAGAAGAHIAMTTLPMAWFETRRLGTALGIITGGTGVGVILTGLMVPPILLSQGVDGWRVCWAIMALIALCVAVLGSILLKERPSNPSFPARNHSEGGDLQKPPVKNGGLSLRSIVAIYFIFGFAYNIYATYFVAYMVEDLFIPEKTAGEIWAVFGWMCMVSGVLWGSVSDRLGRRKALLWNNSIISLAVFLALFFHRPLWLVLSAFCFGLTFLGTVAVIAAATGDQVGEKRASVYGLITLIHGIGQFLGTTTGGLLKDLTGSFQLTLVSSLTGFLLCVVLTALSRRGSRPLPFHGDAG